MKELEQRCGICGKRMGWGLDDNRCCCAVQGVLTLTVHTEIVIDLSTNCQVGIVMIGSEKEL